MSLSHNMYLMSLLEAAKDKDKDAKKKKSDAAEDDQSDTAAPDTAAEEPATEEEDTNETEETSDEPNDTTDNPGEESKTDDEDQNEEEQSEDETPEENKDAADDFTLDSDTSDDSTDNEPPPDGLVDPDDDGSTGDEEDPDAETNVHVNILNLSKLDRTLAKRRCLNDYYDLRTSIDTFRNIIDRNEAAIEPDVRTQAVEQLNKLYTTVSEYLMYKFSYSNYEDTLQHYLLFMRAMNDIVKNVKENGLNIK